jgi:hypothetical protein
MMVDSQTDPQSPPPCRVVRKQLRVHWPWTERQHKEGHKRKIEATLVDRYQLRRP